MKKNLQKSANNTSGEQYQCEKKIFKVSEQYQWRTIPVANNTSVPTVTINFEITVIFSIKCFFKTSFIVLNKHKQHNWYCILMIHS